MPLHRKTKHWQPIFILYCSYNVWQNAHSREYRLMSPKCTGICHRYSVCFFFARMPSHISHQRLQLYPISANSCFFFMSPPPRLIFASIHIIVWSHFAANKKLIPWLHARNLVSPFLKIADISGTKNSLETLFHHHIHFIHMTCLGLAEIVGLVMFLLFLRLWIFGQANASYLFFKCYA